MMYVDVSESVFEQILAAAVSYGYWVLFGVVCFLMMFPEYILMSCV